MFPRELSKIEFDALMKLLPENKPGYYEYRGKIKRKLIIGFGRFGGGNFILGPEGDVPDLNTPSSPVFAMGKVTTGNNSHHVNIHEENDGKIEIELDGIDAPDNDSLAIIDAWSYSEWLPGEKAPHDDSTVREVTLSGNKYILVIAPSHKRIWMHEYESGINYLIPVTNYFNELMMLKREKSVKRTNDIFNEINTFDDKQLVDAFKNYDRYLNKFKIDYDDLQNPDNRRRKKNFGLFN